MEIHFLKHHNAYTNKFNHALNELYDLGFQNITSLSYLEILTSLDKIPESHRQAIRNQGSSFNLFFFFFLLCLFLLKKSLLTY